MLRSLTSTPGPGPAEHALQPELSRCRPAATALDERAERAAERRVKDQPWHCASPRVAPWLMIATGMPSLAACRTNR